MLLLYNMINVSLGLSLADKNFHYWAQKYLNSTIYFHPSVDLWFQLSSKSWNPGPNFIFPFLVSVFCMNKLLDILVNSNRQKEYPVLSGLSVTRWGFSYINFLTSCSYPALSNQFVRNYYSFSSYTSGNKHSIWNISRDKIDQSLTKIEFAFQPLFGPFPNDYSY